MIWNHLAAYKLMNVFLQSFIQAPNTQVYY